MNSPCRKNEIVLSLDTEEGKKQQLYICVPKNYKKNIFNASVYGPIKDVIDAPTSLCMHIIIFSYNFNCYILGRIYY